MNKDEKFAFNTGWWSGLVSCLIGLCAAGSFLYYAGALKVHTYLGYLVFAIDYHW